jgi:hypothetical protein
MSSERSRRHTTPRGRDSFFYVEIYVESGVVPVRSQKDTHVIEANLIGLKI